MGYIYKITNNINNHCYIGQTIIDIDYRWKQHCYHAYHNVSEEYNFPLHQAIRKYGQESFTVELIEECPDTQLNDKEIYYIQYYDSYKNGYNAALGGLGHSKYSYDDIVNYFLAHDNSVVDTCNHFHIYDQVVYSALKSKNIDYLHLPKSTIKHTHHKKIMLVEKGLIFNNMAEIDKYFNKQVHGNIRRCLNGITKKAYGYTWKEVD